jgi:hypothetical protein
MEGVNGRDRRIVPPVSKLPRVRERARSNPTRGGLESSRIGPQCRTVEFRRLPKIQIGFVVRRCVLALGRQPTPREFSDWANTAGEGGMALFGRRISVAEAEVILRHQARPVTARSAEPFEAARVEDLPVELRASDDVRDKVVDFAAIKARRQRG